MPGGLGPRDHAAGRLRPENPREVPQEGDGYRGGQRQAQHNEDAADQHVRDDDVRAEPEREKARWLAVPLFRRYHVDAYSAPRLKLGRRLRNWLHLVRIKHLQPAR